MFMVAHDCENITSEPVQNEVFRIIISILNESPEGYSDWTEL